MSIKSLVTLLYILFSLPFQTEDAMDISSEEPKVKESFMSRTPSKPYFPTQNEVDDLIRNLNFTVKR